MQRIKNVMLAAGGVFSLMAAVAVSAVPVSASSHLSLEPYQFVGDAEVCGGTAGTDTITAEWTTVAGDTESAILLEKSGDTSNCAAAGIDIITDLEGAPASELNSLSYDYLDGGHCGAGAPRINIETDAGTSTELGCMYGTQESLGNGWTRVTFSEAQIDAAVTATGGTTLENLYIVFDEGSDVVSETITTPGTIYLDNITVNGEVISEDTTEEETTPTTKEECKEGGWMSFGVYKNQGDCVSFVASKGKAKGNPVVDFFTGLFRR